MLPLLLILFAGAAELGRLFYTYTTLTKASEVGARYLSSSFQAQSPTASEATAAQTAGKSMVVCGFTNCANQTPVLPGLTTANVNVTFTVRNNIKYVKVQITGYNYTAGAFNLASFTGKATSAFYFALTPATEMRYME